MSDDTQAAEPHMVRVIGGPHDGAWEDARQSDSVASIDPLGAAFDFVYDLRPLHVHGETVQALVLRGISTPDAQMIYESHVANDKR